MMITNDGEGRRDLRGPRLRGLCHPNLSAPAKRGVLGQRVPSLFIASSLEMYLDVEVLKGIFPWRTRYPLS